LAAADAEAYGRYIEARRTRGDVEGALAEATRVPLRIARAASSVAAAAADLARDGLPAAAADAATAALLSRGACAAAALTVRVNAAMLEDRELARALAAEAERSERAAGDAASDAARAAAPSP
ncbi:MAG TPA: cyclodeaminase/cyclohydrolase family protein, partial [Gemmatimonadaceae bacterium]|nr:cyclodeaminase/cyclohydrolase family protein [Gemmatimonadaceae bacterium]